MIGHVISIEGIDGCGKTTLAYNLADALEETIDRRPIVTSAISAGTTHIGESIGRILTASSSALDAEAELLLITAARIQNLREVIIPEVEKGGIVISDRFIDSMYAYQRSRGGRPLSTHYLDKHARKWGLDFPASSYIMLDIRPDHPRLDFDEDNRLERRSMDDWKTIRSILMERTLNHPNSMVIDTVAHDERLTTNVALSHVMRCIRK